MSFAISPQLARPLGATCFCALLAVVLPRGRLTISRAANTRQKGRKGAKAVAACGGYPRRGLVFYVKMRNTIIYEGRL